MTESSSCGKWFHRMCERAKVRNYDENNTDGWFCNKYLPDLLNLVKNLYIMFFSGTDLLNIKSRYSAIHKLFLPDEISVFWSFYVQI